MELMIDIFCRCGVENGERPKLDGVGISIIPHEEVNLEKHKGC